MLTKSQEENQQTNEEKKVVSVKVLVSASPGMLRDSLITILASFPFINIVGSLVDDRNCIQEIEQFQPDIVLTDCSSVMHCTKLIRLIHDRCSKTKCIAITDGFQTSKQAMELGVDATLIKGYSRKDLDQVLRRVAYNSHSNLNSQEGKNVE